MILESGLTGEHHQGPPLTDYERFRAEHEAQLGELVRNLEKAASVTDLRVAWTGSKLVNSIAGYVSEDAHKQFTKAVVEVLENLGLDMNSDDERVTLLLKTIEIAEVDEKGNYNYGLHEPIMTALYRIISAGDPIPERGLKLRRLTTLVDAKLNITDKALEYTADDKYTQDHLFPRKAYRRVVNPESEFWGFAVSTDTWPDAPNIYIYMPTGLVPRAEVYRTDGPAYGVRNSMNKNPVYVPRLISVQGISVGRRSQGRQVDTKNHMVERFLNYISSEI